MRVELTTTMSGSFINNVVEDMKTRNWIYTASSTVAQFKTTVAAITNFLGMFKSKSKRVAVKLDDSKGNLIVGAIVSYTESDDPSIPGNWDYVWTFDKKDLDPTEESDILVYSIADEGVKQTIAKRAWDDEHMTYCSEEHITSTNIRLFELLFEYLDQNAKEGEPFEVVLDGYFTTSVEVIDGEKVKSFIPDGAMKRLIKDDDAASENVVE